MNKNEEESRRWLERLTGNRREGHSVGGSLFEMEKENPVGSTGLLFIGTSILEVVFGIFIALI